MMMIHVYLTEGDREKRASLADVVLRELHDNSLATGATLLRAVGGFGEHREIHKATILNPEAHLPLVIEFFEENDDAMRAVNYLKKHPGLKIISWPITIHQ
ncbi:MULTISPECIES: DUF190 domain-containing protein [Acidithrix]|uniref:Uncharacterized protein n=1 Tax=Acidithrix ferrooxidans TaxID=1280514 RepID=A0A0D8HKH5_9ACTN|nr:MULTISPECIES: DUF190 domain-containing protein [Acidithrix]KJF18460.1 hypothetical protein AXFE_06900 [Acidithrix ferrooxidans]CAG4934669.1 unnamed protein product [Acidithrix sp. C25]